MQPFTGLGIYSDALRLLMHADQFIRFQWSTDCHYDVHTDACFITSTRGTFIAIPFVNSQREYFIFYANHIWIRFYMTAFFGGWWNCLKSQICRLHNLCGMGQCYSIIQAGKVRIYIHIYDRKMGMAWWVNLQHMRRAIHIFQCYAWILHGDEYAVYFYSYGLLTMQRINYMVPNQVPECGYTKHEIILINFFQSKPNKSRSKHMHILWYLYYGPLKIFLTHEARGTNEFPCSSCKRDFQHHEEGLFIACIIHKQGYWQESCSHKRQWLYTNLFCCDPFWSMKIIKEATAFLDVEAYLSR